MQAMERESRLGLRKQRLAGIMEKPGAGRLRKPAKPSGIS